MKVYFNSWISDYKRPFGAIANNSTCKFNLYVESFDPNIKVSFILFEDGKWEQDKAKEYIMTRKKDNIFSVDVEFTNVGYYFYYFKVVEYGKIISIVKNPLNNDSIVSDNIYNKWQLTVYNSILNDSETGFENSVMYQIFPDSFYREEIRKSGILSDRIIIDTNYAGIIEDGDRKNIKNNTYYGGNIEGIRRKLSYLKDMGINVIYLNPIFEAHSNHRYNTANFMNLDPLLGTNEEFISFCKDAHNMGIKIILDGVFNHVGADSIYFNKFKRYDILGAYNSKSSTYYSWFKNNFYHYPDSYKGWWGDAKGLPAVDTYAPEYIEYICGENGVVKTWLERGADGFRLDVIDELPNEFIDILCSSIKKYGGKIIIGEVWEDATEKFDMYGKRRRYLLGSQIDTVMNYPFFNCAYSYIKYGDFSNLYNGIMSIFEHYPKYSIKLLMNLLSTHDIERISNRLASEGKREFTKEQLAYSRKMLLLLFVMQFTFPGIPCIYYGDEIAMMGKGNLENRRYFNWECKDNSFIQYIKELASLKKNNEALQGDFSFLQLTKEVLIYKRVHNKKSIIVIINRSENRYILKDIHCIKGIIDKANLIFSTNNFDKYILNPYSAMILDNSEL